MRVIRFISILVALRLVIAPAEAVEPGLPSKTSVWTAILRAVGAKHPDPELRNPDYLAQRFIGPRERALLRDYPADVVDLDYATALKRLPDPQAVLGLHLRTKHVDATLDEALRNAVRQIVILGAGFDTRGYRFRERLAGIRFVEVDYPPTLEYKKRRVREIFGRLPSHVRYVPMDFAKDSLLQRLKSGGYSEADKTLFIWEGVTRYIPESAVRNTLRFVRDHSAIGSSIVFDYMRADNTSLNDPNTRPARWGEPFIFGFPGLNATAFVEREGLAVTSDVTGADLWKRFAVRADGTSPFPEPAVVDPRSPAAANVARYCIARVAAR
jgi:methyltransferase (TIGR00027 family)